MNVSVLNCIFFRQHGRKSRATGGLVPQNLELETLMQIVPQMFQNFKDQNAYVAFTIQKNVCL